MGCESSQLTNMPQSTQIKISVVDSAFMKPQNESVRKEMASVSIDYDYFISLDCFFDEFAKRYYNKVVTGVDNYKQLLKEFQDQSFSPNIFVVLNGSKIEENLPFNVKLVENYSELIKIIQEKKEGRINDKQRKNLKNCYLKILSKPGPKTSQQTIFEAALAKAGITYEFYNSFQLLEQSVANNVPEFIVTDYIYHREVVEMVKNSKTRVICYCSFDKQESYCPDLYSISSNYLDITQDLKQELKVTGNNTVKCTKAYLYTHNLEDSDEIQYQIERFGLQIRPFNNAEKVIKETTYFFCVTVLALESEIKTLSKYFDKNHYLDRVKLISLPQNNEPTLKNLYKTIRNIKKGYRVEKSVTNSIDIIDKHYDNVKFEQIKKQLQANSIICNGFTNLSSYIKTKKFISPFIICNYEERTLLIKYIKQLQCKAKIIIFCNKNKINEEIKNNKNFAFVSSHFGKIIKFINKTLVFIPKIYREEDSKFNQKIQKLKSKNKRISALKWGQIDNTEILSKSDENFEFLNISAETNNASIRDIQKTVSMLWKIDTKICQNFSGFRNQFAESLGELRKMYEISYPEQKFKILIEKIKESAISELMSRIKEYFEAENQLGLQINKSLVKTQNLLKKQIESLKEFLLLMFLNYSSAFNMPKTQKLRLKHWMSNSLIEKCEINSYLFCKNFLIAYEDTADDMDRLSPVKLEIEFQYNPLTQPEIYFNSFITHKDKFIFSPFSQFQVIDIIKAGSFKIIKLKYKKNVQFLKYIFADNILANHNSFQQLHHKIENSPKQINIVDDNNKQIVKNNLERCQAIQNFKKGNLQQAIKAHKVLIKEAQEQQNFNSALINEIQFQLACFTLKAEKMEEAGELFKQLLNSNPGYYIKQQCQLMIKQTLSGQQAQTSKQQKFSEKALKTFTWLKNSNSDKDSEENNENLALKSDEEQFDEGPIIFDSEVPCMEIHDLEEIQKENLYPD